ncbi:hypothetical protein D3C75_872620 [compost metagenome]
MGVYDAADIGKFTVQRQMGGGVRGGLFAALDGLATGEVDHHHVLGHHVFIFHAGRLDHHQPAFAIHRADVAPGEGHQVMARQVEVGFQYLLFQLRQR